MVSQDWAEKFLAKLGLGVAFGSICGSSLDVWYKDLDRLVDHFDQAVGRHGVVEYDGIGHSLPKYQSFFLCTCKIEQINSVVVPSPFHLVWNHSRLSTFHMNDRRRTRTVG